MSKPEPGFGVWDCERMLRVHCPWRWEKLDRTSHEDVRHCRECDRDVYLSRTSPDSVGHGERGRCAAIPEKLSRVGMKGEPSPEEVFRMKDLADRGLAWWREVLLRQTALDVQRVDKIRAIHEGLEMYASAYCPEHLAFVRRAMRDGGVPAMRSRYLPGHLRDRDHPVEGSLRAMRFRGEPIASERPLG
jgi:hypothetical protein